MVAHEPKSAFGDLNQAVAEQIAASGPKVRQLIIDYLSNDEIENRKSMVVRAYRKLKYFNENLDKIEAQPVGFTKDGKEGQRLFTKEQIEERKKLSDSIKRHEEALEEALADNCCYEKLRELLNVKS